MQLWILKDLQESVTYNRSQINYLYFLLIDENSRSAFGIYLKLPNKIVSASF